MSVNQVNEPERNINVVQESIIVEQLISQNADPIIEIAQMVQDYSDIGCQTQIETCEIACQYEEPIIQIPKHKQILKMNGIFEKSTTKYLTELPTIVDDIKLFNGHLQVLVDSITYDISKIPIFRQYKSPEVDPLNRVQQLQEMTYDMVSYKQYKTDNVEKPTFLNMRIDNRNGNQLPALIAKLRNETGIKCQLKTPLLCYFDMETFDTDLQYKDIPLHNRQTSHVSMISLVYNQIAILFHLDLYTIDIEVAQSKILQHCDKSYEIQTQSADNENSMMLLFVMKLKELSENQTVILQGFNSSNDKRDEGRLGYDGSFLLRNLRSSVKFETRRCTGSGNFPKQLTQIELLPNVYFVDMMLLYDENSKTQKKNMEGTGSLSNYLKYYQIPDKLEGNHEKQRNVQIYGGDITDYGTYCLYDSICLQLVGDKHKIIDQRLNFCYQFGIPLSLALYQTSVNILLLKLMIEFYDQGYMFAYSKFSKYMETRDKKGAFAGQCPKHLQFKVLKNTHIFDFQSQYPNVGIQYNISPETYSSEYKQGYYKVQINYNVDQPDDLPEDQKIYAYFDNTKLGIISEFQRRLFEERVSTKQLQKQYKKDSIEWQTLEVKQLSLKEYINSAYGLQNDHTGQLYRYECGSSITGGARTVLDYAIKVAVQIFRSQRIFADTDSLAFQYEGSDVKDKFQILQQTILKEHPRMMLEFEKSYEAIIYPENKKSYINIDKKGTLITKGLSYNKYSLQYRERLYQLCKQILTNTTDKTPIDFCNQYISELKIYIQSIVDNKQIDLLSEFVNTRKFNKTITKTGTKTLTGYLQETHKELTSFNTIPFNCNTKKEWCHYPIEKINQDNICKVRVNDLVADLTHPLKTFFKVQLPKSQSYIGENIKSNYIIVRIQTTRYNQKAMMSINDLQKMIKSEGNFKSIHEVVTTDVCKMYFDIEHETIKISAFKLTQVIQDIIQNYNVKIHIADGCKVEQMSYHVVVEIKCNKQVTRFIATLINARLGNICDLGVYSHNHTIRLPGCIKIDASDNKIQYRKFKPITVSQFTDFLITGDSDQMLDYIDYISFDKSLPISDAKQFRLKADLQSVDNVLKSFNLCGKITNKYQIIVTNKPYNCPGCNNIQKSDNLKIHNNRIFCYDQGCRGIEVNSIQQMPQAKQLKNADIQNSYKVKYNLDNAHHTFVKSQMGTGKTENLLKITSLDVVRVQRYKYIVVISFRRTFADEFCEKMGFVNYQACSGRDIKLSEHKRICIQYESLHKLDIDCDVDLVVFDEIESIWSQISAFDKRENNMNTLKLIELLRYKSLIMDAVLQQSTINVIGHISQIDNIQVYENEYKMQSQRKMFVDTDPSDKIILKSITQDLALGKNLVINSGSKRLARTIEQLAKDLNVSVAIYDGDNNRVLEQFGKTQTMGSHKKEQLQNPNKYWTQVRVLIYTATISAGVSFTAKHFNVQYGILKNKSSDVIAFIQGNHRVRDLSDQVHKIFIFPLHHDDFKLDPISVSNKQNSFNSRSIYVRNNQIQQIEVFLQARQNTLRSFAKELFLLWSEQSGYQIIMNQDQELIDAVKLPDHVEELEIQQEFIFTEEEFNKLPYLMKMNDFSLTHCDPNMESKIQIVSLANIYQMNYQDIMTLYDARQIADGWNKLIQNREHKIRLNLTQIALNKTKVAEFAEDHYQQIQQELLDYLEHVRRFNSQITTNLNITTDFQKTKFIEAFITGIRTYDQIKLMLQSPQTIEEELLKISTQIGSSTKILNNRVSCLGYQFKSKGKETKVTVDGKRYSQRTYTYHLDKIAISEADQQYLQ